MMKYLMAIHRYCIHFFSLTIESLLTGKRRILGIYKNNPIAEFDERKIDFGKIWP